MHAEIARLTAALANANAELLRAARDSGAAWQRACEREAALAEAQAVVDEVYKLLYDSPELNMSNYTHDQCAELNTAVCAAVCVIDTYRKVAARPGGEVQP